MMLYTMDNFAAEDDHVTPDELKAFHGWSTMRKRALCLKVGP